MDAGRGALCVGADRRLSGKEDAERQAEQGERGALSAKAPEGVRFAQGGGPEHDTKEDRGAGDRASPEHDVRQGALEVEAVGHVHSERLPEVLQEHGHGGHDADLAAGSEGERGLADVRGSCHDAGSGQGAGEDSHPPGAEALAAQVRGRRLTQEDIQPLRMYDPRTNHSFDGIMNVHGKGRAGGKWRTLAWAPETKGVVEEYDRIRQELIHHALARHPDLMVPSEYIIYEHTGGLAPYGKSGIDSIVQRVAKRAGIKRKIWNHTLRRTGARIGVLRGRGARGDNGGSGAFQRKRDDKVPRANGQRAGLGADQGVRVPEGGQAEDGSGGQNGGVDIADKSVLVSDVQKCSGQNEGVARYVEWAQPDLNRRPSPCKGNVITARP